MGAEYLDIGCPPATELREELGSVLVNAVLITQDVAVGRIAEEEDPEMREVSR